MSRPTTPLAGLASGTHCLPCGSIGGVFQRHDSRILFLTPILGGGGGRIRLFPCAEFPQIGVWRAVCAYTQGSSAKKDCALCVELFRLTYSHAGSCRTSARQ